MPNPAKPVRRQIRFTSRGWLLVVAGIMLSIGAYPSGRHELLVAGCFALLLALGGLVLARLRSPTLSVIRLFAPSVLSADTAGRVTLRIHNRGNLLTPKLLVSDTVPFSAADPPRRTISVGPHRTVMLDYPIHPSRRGIFWVEPLLVSSTDPFGMAKSRLTVGEADRLTVVPAITSLGESKATLIDGDGLAHLVQRRLSGNDDDLRTREYRTGDALRRVHWRASARHGELMVRQEEHRSRPEARIIIDTRLDAYPDVFSKNPGHSEHFEWAVQLLSSLAIHLDKNGLRPSVTETASPQVQALGESWEGGQHTWAFLLSLAAIKLQKTPGALASLPDPGTPIFAILADPDNQVIDWVLQGNRGTVFALEMPKQKRKRFHEAGWRCVEVHRGDSVWDAWQAHMATEKMFRDHR